MIEYKNNENHICPECAIKNDKTCYQSYGGYWHPLDFTDDNKPLTEEDIKKLLTERNDIAIDCFEYTDDEREYGLFLRTRHVGGSGDNMDLPWGGQCVHLKENGCDLSFDERPYGCRIFVPDPYGKCGTGNEEKDSYSWWKDYWTILNDMYWDYDTKNYTGEIRDVFDGSFNDLFRLL